MILKLHDLVVWQVFESNDDFWLYLMSKHSVQLLLQASDQWMPLLGRHHSAPRRPQAMRYTHLANKGVKLSLEKKRGRLMLGWISNSCRIRCKSLWIVDHSKFSKFPKPRIKVQKVISSGVTNSPNKSSKKVSASSNLLFRTQISTNAVASYQTISISHNSNIVYLSI